MFSTDEIFVKVTYREWRTKRGDGETVSSVLCCRKGKKQPLSLFFLCFMSGSVYWELQTKVRSWVGTFDISVEMRARKEDALFSCDWTVFVREKAPTKINQSREKLVLVSDVYRIRTRVKSSHPVERFACA